MFTVSLAETIFAQAEPLDGWGEFLAAYGPFAPFAAGCIYIIHTLWKSLKEKEKEITRLTDATIEKVLPKVIESTQVLKDAATVIKETEATARETKRVGELLERTVPLLERLDRQAGHASGNRS